MPPLSQCLGLVLLVACPAALTAQTVASNAPAPRGPEMPAAAYPTGPGESLAAAQTQSPPISYSPRRDQPVLLPPHARSAGGEAVKSGGGLSSPIALAGSLAIVLGLFFALVWVFRRAAPKGSTLLPGEVVEVLGRAPLAGRQCMHLLRCGNKLLLVSVTPVGAETLTEVTDPVEVDRLAGLCRQAHPQSATATFRQVLNQFGSRQENRHA